MFWLQIELIFHASPCATRYLLEVQKGSLIACTILKFLVTLCMESREEIRVAVELTVSLAILVSKTDRFFCTRVDQLSAAHGNLMSCNIFITWICSHIPTLIFFPKSTNLLYIWLVSFTFSIQSSASRRILLCSCIVIMIVKINILFLSGLLHNSFHV